ncbi:MAG: hypothetical protein A3F67_05200 [Verrucomicrobia bacterium RIFCSPHIGHO2_12_FULL_41_10]|nr:MAG: hypothetical protein A3F67_05200 [Verrucomicrobia bacterium RIFCSPHIGHO2_12_FULL_41_10]
MPGNGGLRCGGYTGSGFCPGSGEFYCADGNPGSSGGGTSIFGYIAPGGYGGYNGVASIGASQGGAGGTAGNFWGTNGVKAADRPSGGARTTGGAAGIDFLGEGYGTGSGGAGGNGQDTNHIEGNEATSGANSFGYGFILLEYNVGNVSTSPINIQAGSSIYPATATASFPYGFSASTAVFSGVAQVTGFNMPTGASNGYVLTSDGVGGGSWQAETVPSLTNPSITGYAKFNSTSTQLSSAGTGIIFYDSASNKFLKSENGGSAMPMVDPIGILPRIQANILANDGDTGYVNVISTTGAGKLRSINFLTVSQEGAGVCTFYQKIIVDGYETSLSTASPFVSGGSKNFIIKSDIASSSSLFKLINSGLDAELSFESLDVDFRISLQIQHRMVCPAFHGRYSYATVEIEKYQ